MAAMSSTSVNPRLGLLAAKVLISRFVCRAALAAGSAGQRCSFLFSRQFGTVGCSFLFSRQFGTVGCSFLFSRQFGTGLPWYALRATSHTPVPTWLVGM